MPLVVAAGKGWFMVRSTLIASVVLFTAGGSLAQAHVALRAVQFDSRATMQLWLHSSNGQASLNSLGAVPVRRGEGFVDLGSNPNTGGRIEASWEELVGTERNTLRVIFRTTDGSQLVPAGSTLPGGIPAAFWSWSFGVNNRVDFHEWVSQVRVDQARASFSLDGGRSFAQIPSINIRPSLPQPNDNWQGFDNGTLLTGAYIGVGINYVSLEYAYVVVPAPASATLMGGLALLATRRRRG
ncbi:MAG: hypothetical protein SFZ23_08140 [Planctomycetota bacterium]|nr:hypothetical protein [Planctomycetota bacterium]